jgi:hypothetical protein
VQIQLDLSCETLLLDNENIVEQYCLILDLVELIVIVSTTNIVYQLQTLVYQLYHRMCCMINNCSWNVASLALRH